jgi:hypothetical protein
MVFYKTIGFHLFFLICLENIRITNNRRLNTTVLDISSISPKFIKVNTPPTHNETFIIFQILDNYKSSYEYKLFISVLDKNIYLKDTNYYKNWLFSNEDYDNFLENRENIWKEWSLKIVTNQRIIKLSDLNQSINIIK